MNNTKTFDVYEDPGHGWVKVKLSYIKKLGIQDEISSYSYLRGEYAYLEEDCDASVLIAALKKNGIEAKFRSHHSDKSSKIRNYLSYNAAYIDWDSCEVSY
jgi:hypothetical protein